ncbi:MAG: MFS transporter, partial [Ferrovibrio sp.]
MTGQAQAPARTSYFIYACILAAAFMAFLSFGVRTSFGIFLEPILAERGWEREVFGLALAIQNLVWGLAQPLAGAAADSRGYGRVLIGGAALYVLGTAGMAFATTPFAFYMLGGVVTGLGLAGASWTICVGAAVRLAPPHLQGWATGLAIAACSLGQLTLVTLGQSFIVAYGWHAALYLMAAGVAVMVPGALLLASGTGKSTTASRSSLSETLRAAAGSRSFWLVSAGFTICGFHAGFVFTHLPAYATSIGLTPEIGAWALAAVGLTNLFSSYAVGILGERISKRKILIWIYALRAAALCAIVLYPGQSWSLLLIAASLGVFWMSSIPPTSRLLGQIFGPYFTGTLLGAVFFGHQVGAFIGAWLGGVVYDAMG